MSQYQKVSYATDFRGNTRKLKRAFEGTDGSYNGVWIQSSYSRKIGSVNGWFDW